jgi:hypothetical protein
VSTDTIHTALLGIASGGEDHIRLGDGLWLVRPNTQLLSHRWDWVQSQGEMQEEEERTSRYLVCEYPSWIEGEDSAITQNRGMDRFYAGLIAIQIIKPIRTLGLIYRHPQLQYEKRRPMEPGQWAMMNEFDDTMLAQIPGMIERIQPAINGKNVEQRNALTLLQLGLEHFHPYIAGLLWVTGLEAIFDSGGREEFKKKLCECLGQDTLAFPNWHSRPNAPPYTVEEIAIPLFTLRNKLAHGADLRSAAKDPKHPVDFTRQMSLTQDTGDVNYAVLLSEAACHLLCQVLRIVL